MSELKDQIEIGVLEAELGTQKALNRMPKILRWLTIITVLGATPLFFVSKAISKNYWLKKYEQSLALTKQSFTQAIAPEVGGVSLTTMGTNIYSAAVFVENKNLDLSAEGLKYQFTFFNTQKQKIYSSPSETLFLLPGQSKYVILPRFQTNDTVAFANFNFLSDIRWQKRINIPIINLTTSQPRVYQQGSPLSFVVEGDFTNKSPYKLANVKLTFLLLDSKQQIVGTSSRTENAVRPGEKRAYKQLWPNINGSNIVEVKVFTDTDTLNPDNLGQTSIPSGSASDLSRPE